MEQFAKAQNQASAGQDLNYELLIRADYFSVFVWVIFQMITHL